MIDKKDKLRNKTSLVVHWLSGSGDCRSNPVGGEYFSSFGFESRSHDCSLLLN